MGFNTVAMILNDHMHNLAEAPHALAYALCHPPQFGEASMKRWKDHFKEVATKHNEHLPCASPLGGLNILPTFHADDVHFIFAGRNSLERLEVHKYGTAKVPNWEKVPGGLKKLDLNPKTVNTVTLILPDWWTK